MRLVRPRHRSMGPAPGCLGGPPAAAAASASPPSSCSAAAAGPAGAGVEVRASLGDSSATPPGRGARLGESSSGVPEKCWGRAGPARLGEKGCAAVRG
jgi:hypothetical protein